jgi:hypothetical protein
MNDPKLQEAPGTSVTTWQDTLQKYAMETVKNEQPVGQFFSIKSGVLQFGGVPIPNNTMDVVMIASIHENVYYKDRYNADKPSGPLCFAFSKDGVKMQPHTLAFDSQSIDCASCKQNAWGSDPQGGRGKACKNVRRVAMMSASAVSEPTSVGSAVIGYLRVPVTSVANYARAVATIASRNLPPFAVVTRVKVVPDAKTQVKVEFEPLHSITEPSVLQALISRYEIEQNLIDFPYTSGQDEESASKPSHQQPAAAPATKPKF